MDLIIDITLLTFLGITALAINRIDKLFCIIMLSGIYSLLCASLFVTMDAVDVAFTEAAVGTGIATVLLLSTIGATDTRQRSAPHRPLLALLVVPVLVLVGPFLGHPIDLSFNVYELVAIIAAVVVSNLVSLDGRSDWFEGVLLIAAYVILAAGFFFEAVPSA